MGTTSKLKNEIGIKNKIIAEQVIRKKEADIYRTGIIFYLCTHLHLRNYLKHLRFFSIMVSFIIFFLPISHKTFICENEGCLRFSSRFAISGNEKSYWKIMFHSRS